MNQNILKKWVAALRSKKYKKCVGALHVMETENTSCSYCVLGVLTDLYQKNQKKEKKALLKTAIKGRYMAYGGKTDLPPYCVARWAGIDDNEADTMVAMNDSGKSFAYMAKYIEKNPLNLNNFY